MSATLISCGTPGSRSCGRAEGPIGHEIRLAARRLASEVDQLAEDAGAVAVHGVGAQPKRGHALRIPRFDDDPRGEPRRRVHDGGARDHQPDTAARPLLLERDLARRHLAHVDQAGAHRRLDDAVLQLDSGDDPRREEMRIAVQSAVCPPSGSEDSDPV